MIKVLDVYKVRPFDWEASVWYDNIIFYFRAFTKWGAQRKAYHFKREHEEQS
jgi:hypothetical protein